MPIISNFPTGIDGSAYGTCSTASDVAAKTVTFSGFKLVTGASVKVKFLNENEASNITLNVNETGAKAIMYHGNPIGSNTIKANGVYEFSFDGTNWDYVGALGSNAGTVQKVETNAILLASEWQGEEAPFTYCVNFPKHSNTKDFVELFIDTSATDEQLAAIQAANIAKGYWQDNTTLVLVAHGEKPEIDVPVVFYTEEVVITQEYQAVVKEVDFTLFASEWQGTEVPFTYELEFPKHDNQTDYVKLMAKEETTPEEMAVLDSLNIKKAEWATNKTLVLYAYGTKPEIDLPITVAVDSLFGSVNLDYYTKEETEALITSMIEESWTSIIGGAY